MIEGNCELSRRGLLGTIGAAMLAAAMVRRLPSVATQYVPVEEESPPSMPEGIPSAREGTSHYTLIGLL